MDLSQWVLDQFEDTAARLSGQVLDLVPPARRREQPGGGNSVLWGCFHVARHADLALAVVAPDQQAPLAQLLALGPVADGGNGLQEAEPSWAAELPPGEIDAYLGVVLARVRHFLSAIVPGRLDVVPDIQPRLAGAGVEAGEFAWLYQMWAARPVAFFVRWPLIGHIANHTGEMIATRNRLGLSPF